MHLRDAGAGSGAARRAQVGEAQALELRIGEALAAVRRRRRLERLGVAAGFDPALAQLRQPGFDVS
jgi:hypothetical protein